MRVTRPGGTRSAAWLVLALVLVGTSPALAHPHIWVVAKATIRLDRDNRLVGVEQAWTFDQAYSAFATLNIGTGPDGRPTSQVLAEVARTNLQTLAPFGYFTNAKGNGAKLDFDPPRDVSATLRDGRLTIAFFLPARPTPKLKLLGLEIFDGSFFVSFTLDRAADAIRLAAETPGCSLHVIRPAGDAAEGVQLVPDDRAGGAESLKVATEFKSGTIVACP